MKATGTTLTVLAALSLLTLFALADEDHVKARRLVESGAIQPLETILEQVQGQHPGRVLEVELEDEEGRYIYEIELLEASGQVWELKLDAVTGEIIEQEREQEED